MNRALHERPDWTYESPRELALAYSHVEIHGPHAIGTWFCVDMESGAALWDHPIEDANSIRIVSDEVIVASRIQSHGPTTTDVGIFVIERASGRLRWRSEGASLLTCLLSFLPGRRLRGVGTPQGIVGDGLITSEGEVVDLRTGAHLAWAEVATPDGNDWLRDPARCLYTTGSVELPDGDRLEAEIDTGTLRVRRSGRLAWGYELTRDQRHVDGNFYSWRFVDDAILIVAADAPVRATGPDGGLTWNRCRYELLVLDVEDGKPAQRIPLTTDPGSPCRIEDVDTRAVLVSRGRRLACYRWRRGPS